MSNRGDHSSTSSTPGERLRQYVPIMLLAIVVVASPLAIGGVHAVTAGALAAASLVGYSVALVGGTRSGGETGSVLCSIPTVGFGLLAALCLIQLIPVPTAVYRWVQPAGYEALAANWSIVFGESLASGWHTLSLDPRATSEDALRWIALAAATGLAGQVVTDRRHRRRWLGLVVVGAAVVALTGIIQQLSGTELILGLYESEVGARSLSPFVSTNHAAAYYGLAALVAVGFSLEYLRRSPVVASLGVAATAGFLMLSATHNSTGALLALAAGLLIFAIAIAIRYSPKTEDGGLRKAAVIGVVVLLVGAIAAIFAPGDWTVDDDASRLDDTSADVRIHLSHQALVAATDHPVVGTGAGAVDRTLAPYLNWTELRGLSIPTIENEPVEWFMTLGPVVALLIALAYLYLLVRLFPHVLRRDGRRGPMMASALLIFLGVVSLVHFPFTALGISLVAMVAIEACLDRRRDPVFVTLSKRQALIGCLLVLAFVIGLFTVRATVLEPGAEADFDVADEQRVQRAMVLYPTDGALMAALSLQARDDGDTSRSLQLAERAFELRPHPQQQVLLARNLAMSEEYERAAEQYADLIDPERHNQYYRWAEDRIRHDLREPEQRAQVLADGRPEHIESFLRRVRRQESEFVAIEVALELIELRPDRPTPHLELVDLYRRSEQWMLAEMYARGLVDRNLEAPDGERPAGLTALLEIFEEQDRVDEARNMARRAFDAGYATPELGRATVELMPEKPDLLDTELRLLFENAINVGCQPPYEPDERRVCWQGRAVIAEIDGRLDRAESLLRRVERLEEDPRPLVALLSRHQRCRELAGVERRHEGERYHSHIEEKLAECVRYDEPEEMDELEQIDEP